MSSRLDERAFLSGPLTAEQFRALARARGYTLAALARLWGLTRARVSQIAADPARPRHYDYALWGTPRRRGHAPRLAAPRLPRASGDARGLEVGEIFIVRESPGEHLPEGEEGVVTRLSGSPPPGRAHLSFGAGSYEENFEVPYLLSAACFLVRTGRLRR